MPLGLNVNQIDILGRFAILLGTESTGVMPKDVYLGIGNAIRARRDSIGMTQKALAELTGLSRTSITNIERGGQALLVHQLLELAKSLRVAPIDLLPQESSKDQAGQGQTISGEFKALLDRLETPSVRRRSR
jgi:transcriptional regulator with XRE-family HTH domain